MTDRPIIFSAAMVQALLAGRKSQTRRVLKEQRHVARPAFVGGRWQWFGTSGAVLGDVLLSYAPGDRLWVREAWAHYQTVNHVRHSDGRAFDQVSDGLAGYRADGHETIEDFCQHVRLMSGCDLEHVVVNGDRWRSPIHMPRWASRLTLLVREVRVQRLQEISEDDARAESCRPAFTDTGDPDAPVCSQPSYRWGFPELWNSIHGPDAWAANPWVAAVSFDVQRKNIDEVAA